MLKIIIKLKNFVQQNFLEEKERWILWIPVFLGGGMWSYFVIKFEPKIYIPIIIFLVLLTPIFIFKKNMRVVIGLIPTTTFIFGFLWANLFSIDKNKVPRLSEKLDYTSIYGQIDNLNSYNKYNIKQRVVIKVFKAENLENPPKKIRLNIRSKISDVKIGDIVKFRAKLFPLSGAVFPNAYDFSEIAYFDEIGATGYLIGDFELIRSNDYTTRNKINNLRNKIASKIESQVEQPASGVEIALLVGIRGLIEQEQLENLQYSGLAHLIAISGLHIALVTLFFFGLARFLLSRNEQITLKYNIKKISAIIAFIGGFAYLVITGMPVSAKRAYIMIALMLTAIVLDRQPSTLRSLAIAAMIVLFFDPYLVMSPSFRMSFSAVTGLITGFGMLNQYGINLFGKNTFTKILFYILGVLFGSLIAEIFISPISIYHFNNYTPYNILANLIAMPLTSFLVMPLGILSFLFMLFGIEKIALIPMSWGINLILKIAEKIVNTENSVYIIGQIPGIIMFLFTIGGLWICLWRRPWRFFGLIPVFIGIFLAITRPLPDIVVDEKAKFFAIMDDEKNLYFSKKPFSNFKQETIMKKMGQKNFNLITSFPKDKNSNAKFLCNDNHCLYSKFDKKAYFVRKNYNLNKIKFEPGSIIIDLTYKGFNENYVNCDNCVVINKNLLQKTGAQLIYFSENDFRFKNTHNPNYQRLWEFHRHSQFH